MNRTSWTPQEQFGAINAFVNKGWQMGIGRISLDELKAAVILAVAECPGRSCGAGSIPARILKMFHVTIDDAERERFAAKVEPVVHVLIMQKVLARFHARPSTLKLVRDYEQVLAGLLRRSVRKPRADGAGAEREEPGLVELDDPAQIRGRSIALVSIPLDTSYHVKLPVELLFSDRTFCTLLFDRETPEQRRRLRDLVGRLRKAGGAPGDWDELAYQLKLRGIDLG